MAENFNLSELVIPGTYVRVRSEGLIRAGGISSGNIGIVGVSKTGQGETHNLSDLASAKAALGAYDAWGTSDGAQLTRAVELLFRNGARQVFARGLAADASSSDYSDAFDELLKEDINLVIAPELSFAAAKTVLGSLVSAAEGQGKDLIAVVGEDASSFTSGELVDHDSGRVILVAPGLKVADTAADGSPEVDLPGGFAAAAVAGLLSSLSPQSSPTNKALPGVGQLSRRLSYGEIKTLLGQRVMVLEQRAGVRVVRGLTTNSGAYTQVTTRRIVDFAKAGIRKSCDPFIGKLNNERVRKALRGAVDGFLATMVQDEALTEYQLEVTASRDDEIAGRAMVNALLKPTFSIDFIAVTLTLQ